MHVRLQFSNPTETLDVDVTEHEKGQLEERKTIEQIIL